jgi:hypothetical protein
MRNHHEKGRDLTRSVLASTKPERARALRAQVRARERAQERRLLHDLTRAVDPDDVETPTAWIDREGLDHLVGHRRMWDNLGALLHWTRRTLATHPDLADRSADGIAAYFRQRLGTDPMVGHAMAHIRHLFDPDDPTARLYAYLDEQDQARAEELAATSEPAGP